MGPWKTVVDRGGRSAAKAAAPGHCSWRVPPVMVCTTIRPSPTRVVSGVELTTWHPAVRASDCRKAGSNGGRANVHHVASGVGRLMALGGPSVQVPMTSQSGDAEAKAGTSNAAARVCDSLVLGRLKFCCGAEAEWSCVEMPVS